MRKFTPFGLVFLYLVGSSAVAEELEYEVIQPIQSRSNLVLESARGRASVERKGAARQRLPLRSTEILTTIAETRGGWTAAGIRGEDSASKLILVHRSNQGTGRLAAPALQRHPLQLRPALAVRGEELEGVAWLEGTDLTSLSVRAASWASGEWAEVTVVAPPARGSQTGLVATVMEDGKWLLAWSAFDGRDDEILWSIGRDGDWSVPQRLDRNNSVPDIMPTVVSTPDGALLSWSRMIDGQYQLLLSRLGANGWSRPQVIGPPGSIEPGFSLLDGQLLLLYRHAWPQAWAVTELSPKGRALRLAVVSDDGKSRPVLMGSSGENVELRWADNRRRALGWEGLP